jgi:hypothetical protein
MDVMQGFQKAYIVDTHLKKNKNKRFSWLQVKVSLRQIPSIMCYIYIYIYIYINTVFRSPHVPTWLHSLHCLFSIYIINIQFWVLPTTWWFSKLTHLLTISPMPWPLTFWWSMAVFFKHYKITKISVRSRHTSYKEMAVTIVIVHITINYYVYKLT